MEISSRVSKEPEIQARIPSAFSNLPGGTGSNTTASGVKAAKALSTSSRSQASSKFLKATSTSGAEVSPPRRAGDGPHATHAATANTALTPQGGNTRDRAVFMDFIGGHLFRVETLECLSPPAERMRQLRRAFELFPPPKPPAPAASFSRLLDRCSTMGTMSVLRMPVPLQLGRAERTICVPFTA